MRPTKKQVQVTEQVVEWYLDNYWLTSADVGAPGTFFDRELVGEFAVSPDAYEAGEPDTLARMLVAVSLFQRLRDQLVLQILRGVTSSQVTELTALDQLADSAVAASCPARHTLDTLRMECDLAKDEQGRGVCGRQQRGSCDLHRHTEILKRYGHFGKVPTSLALAIRASGAHTLPEMLQLTLTRHRTRAQRAEALEAALCAAWRINNKIAAMFLSLVCAPGLSLRQPPWRDGIGWERFILIDSNVDGYLRSIGYSGPGTYDARREYVLALADCIDLRQYSSRLHRFNPRVVQQAIFVFAGRSNRIASSRDCSLQTPPACSECPRALSRLCPVRPSPV